MMNPARKERRSGLEQRQGIRLISSCAASCAVILLLAPAAASALDEPTVAWPPETLLVDGWNVYTEVDLAIEDLPAQLDCSRGAVPNGDQDICGGELSPCQPSAFWSFDSTAEVFFYRIRVGADPLVDSSLGLGSGKYPYRSGTWNLMIDADTDGFKEWSVVLDGNGGGGNNTDIGPSGDDLKIYYSNLDNQCVTPEVISGGVVVDAGDLVWYSNSATQAATVPVDPTLDGARWDFGRTRVVYHDASNSEWGSGWFVDFQFPLSSLTDAFNDGLGGTPLVGPTTSLGFGYTTANSNADPIQKDFASNFCLEPSCDGRFPFADPVCLLCDDPIGPRLGPAALDDVICPIRVTVSILVSDSLQVADGVVTDTIERVSFEYYLDLDGNLVADDGSTWTPMIPAAGSANPDIAGGLAPDGITPSFNDWGVMWDTSGLVTGLYLIRVTAFDDQGHLERRVVASYAVDVTGENCGPGPQPTWQSYADSLHAVRQDVFFDHPESTVHLFGTFEPVIPYHLGIYVPSGTLLGIKLAVFSDTMGGLGTWYPVSCASLLGTFHAVVYPAWFYPPTVHDPVPDPVLNPLLADDEFEIVASDVDVDAVPDCIELTCPDDGGEINDIDSDRDLIPDLYEGIGDDDGDGALNFCDGEEMTVPNLLRNDEATTIEHWTSLLPSIFVNHPADPCMDPLGPNGWADPGEGSLWYGNGSSDQDDFYLYHLTSGDQDPDDQVLGDPTRPVVAYQLDCSGCRLMLHKSGGADPRIVITFILLP